MARRQAYALGITFLFCFELTASCFLNSCPYRRNGRSSNAKCGHCGANDEGVCVAKGVCCTTESCNENNACVDSETLCPPPPCVIGQSIGFCASTTLCCTSEFCQRNLQCLVDMAAQKKDK
ncbi:Protein NTC-1 [Aphelenchoides avenae]|nr:Protein NTC-1 [Aphelenchus avenae]